MPREIFETLTDDATGLILNIVPDDFAERPFDGDDAVVIVILHDRYRNPGAEVAKTLEEAQAFEKANRPGRTPGGTQYAVFPLFLYAHGSVAYRIGDARRSDGAPVNPFIGRAHHAQWDSGRVGFIALRRADFAPSGRRASRATLRRAAEGVAETYTAWANGWCYGYEVKDSDGEELDSCYGFYGLEEALEAGREALALEVDAEPARRDFAAAWCEAVAT